MGGSPTSGPVYDAVRQALADVAQQADIDQAIAAMLEAVTPQIEADFAMRLAAEFERMIESGLLVDPIYNQHEFPAARGQRKRMHDALWERAAEMCFSMIGRTAEQEASAAESADERLQREQALSNRLYRAVFVDRAATERALKDPQAHLRIELLRGVLLGADHAMRAQGIDRRTRDRVAHQIIFGDPPKDPAATADEQLQQALTDEQVRRLQELQASTERPQWPSDPVPTHQE